MKISDFINDPWRDIGQDAMKRGAEICKRNELMNPDANMVMLIGICDIINEQMPPILSPVKGGQELGLHHL